MKKKSGFSKILGAKGAGTVVTAFIGLIIIYIAFGILNPKVFSLLNIQNLLRYAFGDERVYDFLDRLTTDHLTSDITDLCDTIRDELRTDEESE